MAHAEGAGGVAHGTVRCLIQLLLHFPSRLLDRVIRRFVLAHFVQQQAKPIGDLRGLGGGAVLLTREPLALGGVSVVERFLRLDPLLERVGLPFVAHLGSRQLLQGGVGLIQLIAHRAVPLLVADDRDASRPLGTQSCCFPFRSKLSFT